MRRALPCARRRGGLERGKGKQKCVPRLSLSTGGLGEPMGEREDKDTQDGINRLRDLAKLRSHI